MNEIEVRVMTQRFQPPKAGLQNNAAKATRCANRVVQQGTERGEKEVVQMEMEREMETYSPEAEVTF